MVGAEGGPAVACDDRPEKNQLEAMHDTLLFCWHDGGVIPMKSLAPFMTGCCLCAARFKRICERMMRGIAGSKTAAAGSLGAAAAGEGR